MNFRFPLFLAYFWPSLWAQSLGFFEVLVGLQLDLI